MKLDKDGLQSESRTPVPTFAGSGFDRNLIPWSWAVVIVGLSWFPMIRVIAEYGGASVSIGAVLVLASGIIHWLIIGSLLSSTPRIRVDDWIVNISRSRRFIAALAIVWIVVMLIAYPIADSKRSIGAGSDSDDALIGSTQRLLSGVYPYAENTYLNGLISTGPGWLILTLPFGISRATYPLLIPVVLLGGFVLLRSTTYDKSLAGIFILILTTSPSFWEAAVTGHDLPALGLIFAVGIFCWQRFVKARFISNIAIGAVAGLVINARIPFLVFLPLLFLLSSNSSARWRWTMPLTATIVAVGFHIVFYSWGQGDYPPLHLLVGAPGFLSWPGIIFTILVVISISTGFIRWTLITHERILIMFAVTLITLEIIYSTAILLDKNLNFSSWGVSPSASFVLPIVVLSALISSRRFSQMRKINT